ARRPCGRRRRRPAPLAALHGSGEPAAARPPRYHGDPCGAAGGVAARHTPHHRGNRGKLAAGGLPARGGRKRAPPDALRRGLSVLGAPRRGGQVEGSRRQARGDGRSPPRGAAGRRRPAAGNGGSARPPAQGHGDHAARPRLL
ncbi:MAG: hypothetical protein AVDCRST_MAG08-4204, partial [uncultured Acetobacteraceae bacterium]